MKLNRLLYITIASLLVAACSDDSPAMPEAGTDGFTICYTTDVYSNGLSRAGTASEEQLCWSEFNEKGVADLDFYLVDTDGKVTFYKSFPDKTSNVCNVIQEIITFDKDQTEEPTFETVSAASKIVIVANIPLTETDRAGKTLASLYASNLTGLVHNQKQSKFAMYGEVDVPENLSRYRSIVVPLRRIAAKIRVTVKNVSGGYENDFKSILCRYVTDSKVLPEPLMPGFTGVDVNKESLPSTVNMTVHNSMIPERVTSDNNVPLWEYPEDLTETHPAEMIKENGHVYYTYPSDWIDYEQVKNQCKRGVTDGDPTKNTHVGHAEEGGDRYEIMNYDDKAPIANAREMFLIIKAPYNGKDYFYKVPVNYRFASISDQQCYSAADLTDRVFPLYRADRNHFYDIVALIDREGAPTPEKAATNPYFTVRIADMEDGGTFDYIYD